jgi:ribosomal protein L11 methylase PrmA
VPAPLVQRHPASYRDPDSTVFEASGRILRGFTSQGHERLRRVRASGLLDRLVAEGRLVESRDVASPDGDDVRFVQFVEHERLPFISHPYEWPFALLQRAALLHLDIHLTALESGVTLADASAYNVQFRGVKPVFIDLGSFRPYVDGELWSAHRQFCEQFLNPLLLAAEFGIPSNAWLRGSPEGIPTGSIAALLPLRRWLSARHLFHVLLPARAERRAREHEAASVERIRKARLPKEAYAMMLRQLRNWIARLEPSNASRSTWADYGTTRTYESDEIAQKRRHVAEFAGAYRPATLWDLGCNDGEFGELALGAGAARVIGFDADTGALQLACARAERAGLDFLPLYQDAADPSPGSGWLSRERAALLARPRPDAVMALAFVHHLALGRNIPLDEVVSFITSVAPRGLIEFVPKADSTVERMLALKGDLFPGYSLQAFEQAMAAHARIVRRDRVSQSGRELFWFER